MLVGLARCVYFANKPFCNEPADLCSSAWAGVTQIVKIILQTAVQAARQIKEISIIGHPLLYQGVILLNKSDVYILYGPQYLSF